MEKLNSFISVLKEKYNQQGQTGKILIPSLGLLVFCCLCAFAFNLSLAGRRNTPGITPSPSLPTLAGMQPTPTALFGFGSTPLPTLVAPSPLPATPGPATATLVPTQTVLPPTATPVPANTLPPPTDSSSNSIMIVAVDKRAEFVDIRNTGSTPVDLTDWRLVSETGNQPCTLWVTILPNETLRVWSRKGDGGMSCGYHINIWNDNESDPAVLYDPQGREVSRYPQ